MTRESMPRAAYNDLEHARTRMEYRETIRQAVRDARRAELRATLRRIAPHVAYWAIIGGLIVAAVIGMANTPISPSSG